MVNVLLSSLLVLLHYTHYTQAFHQIPTTSSPALFRKVGMAFHKSAISPASPRSPTILACSDKTNPPPPPGDKIREATGKRPSLHPTIINALSEALLIRSDPKSFPETGPMEVPSSYESSDPDSTTTPPTALEVAIAAGDLATQTIYRRTQSSKAVKGDEVSSTFTPDECQLLAGRVVGAVMRFDLLEGALADKVRNVAWVKKYGEEGAFGLLTEELEGDRSGERRREETVDLRLKDDPLLRMCRAECLYALFLLTVEVPAMEKIGKSSPSDLGESTVDFLDSDRLEVLL